MLISVHAKCIKYKTIPKYKLYYIQHNNIYFINKDRMLANIIKTNAIKKYLGCLQSYPIFHYAPLLSFHKLRIKNNFATDKQFKISLNEHKSEIPVQMNAEILVNNRKKIMCQYPFIAIPRYYISKFEQLPIQKALAKDVVAFICLSSSGEQIHKAAFNILFPEKAKYIAFDRQTFENGRQIFTEHFSGRQDQFITTINDVKASLDEKIIAMNILVQFTVSQTLSNYILKLNQSIIAQEQSGTLLALYIHLLVKHRKPHQKYWPVLIKKLNNQQISAKQRISIIKSIISIPNYITIIPNSLINLSIQVIKSQIPLLSNQQIIRIIGMLYMFKSPDGTLLAIELQKFIGQLNPEKDPSRAELFLELITKVIKYSTALSLSCQKFVTDLITNISKYNPFFKQNNVTKQKIISSLFLNFHEDLNPELTNILRAHIFSVVQLIGKNPQIFENQVLIILKLIKSHSKWLSIADQYTLKTFFIKQILPHFENDRSILYESLLMILGPKQSESNQSVSARDNNDGMNSQKQKQEPYPASQSQQIIKYLHLYFSKTCSRNNINELRIHSNICELISLLLLLSKTNLQIQESNVPLICKYSFTTKDIPNLSTLQQLISYMMQLSQQKNADILSTLNNIYPIIQGFINKKYLRFRSAMNLIQLADRCKYRNKYFYFKIEDMLFQLMNKNPKFYFTTHNLYLLKDKFLPHMISGSNFETLIYQTLKSPNSWDQNKRKYLDRQQKRRNKKYKQDQQKRKNNKLEHEQ